MFAFTSPPDCRYVVGVYCETRSIFTVAANQNCANCQPNAASSYLRRVKVFDYLRSAAV